VFSEVRIAPVQHESGPIPNQRWDYTFQEVPSGTRLTRAVEAEPAGFLKLLEPLQRRIVQRQLRTDLQTLKDVVENFLQWPIDLDAFFDAHSSGSCAPNTLSGAMMP
jgi:hypothetical protein